MRQNEHTRQNRPILLPFISNLIQKVNMADKNLTQKLADIQQKLKAPKGQTNKFGGYKYRSCEDILEAVKPLLGDLIMTISDDIINIGDRYYLKATVKLSDGVTNYEVSALAREALSKKGMDDSQITGTASSYARKYALNGLFLIDDTKDADTQDNRENEQESKPQVRKASTLKAKCKEHNCEMTAGKTKDGRDYWYHRSEMGDMCFGRGYKTSTQ